MTGLQERILAATIMIPLGKVTTYSRLARHTKCKSIRAVGTALHQNPDLVEVPCHRVVGSDGSLTGYVAGLPRKRELLMLEGVKFDEKGRVAAECIIDL